VLCSRCAPLWNSTVVVCWSVLQCVVMWCSVLQCFAVCGLRGAPLCNWRVAVFAVCCSLLQCVGVCCLWDATREMQGAAWYWVCCTSNTLIFIKQKWFFRMHTGADTCTCIKCSADAQHWNYKVQKSPMLVQKSPISLPKTPISLPKNPKCTRTRIVWWDIPGCMMTSCGETTRARAKEPFTSTKELYATAKKLHTTTKESFVTTDEPYITAKEPCKSAKEPCISSASACTLTGSVVTWRAALWQRMRLTRPRLFLLLPPDVLPGATGTLIRETPRPKICWDIYIYTYIHTRVLYVETRIFLMIVRICTVHVQVRL